uniref:Putative secreted protein n=1 Tax=Panstrongylus lignarius TaxID=156445 RepID=A0A224Y4P2_9HEMI
MVNLATAVMENLAVLAMADTVVMAEVMEEVMAAMEVMENMVFHFMVMAKDLAIMDMDTRSIMDIMVIPTMVDIIMDKNLPNI